MKYTFFDFKTMQMLMKVEVVWQIDFLNGHEIWYYAHLENQSNSNKIKGLQFDNVRKALLSVFHNFRLY